MYQGIGNLPVTAADHLHDLFIGHKLLHINAFVRQKEGHRAAVLQVELYGAEFVPRVIAHRVRQVHHVDLRVARCAVEGLLIRYAFVEFIAPCRLVIDRRHQCQHGFRRCTDVLDGVLQKAAGVFIHPSLQRLVHFLRSHRTRKGRRIIEFRKTFQGLFIVGDTVPHPDGIRQQRGQYGRIDIIGFPQGFDTGTQRIDRIGLQHIKNLFPGIAVRAFRQHRQRHVDIDRGTDRVFRIVRDQEFAHHGAVIRLHPVLHFEGRVRFGPVFFPPFPVFFRFRERLRIHVFKGTFTGIACKISRHAFVGRLLRDRAPRIARRCRRSGLPRIRFCLCAFRLRLCRTRIRLPGGCTLRAACQHHTAQNNTARFFQCLFHHRPHFPCPKRSATP